MSLSKRIQHYLTWKKHLYRRHQLRREHPLRYLFLEVTRQCNLACAYCGSNCTTRTAETELSVSEWIEVARQIAADFPPAQVMIAVTGGEPLIKKGILELFQELKQLGFRYGIVTNGVVLNAKMAQDLVRVGIGSISLSLDALPPLNDELRGSGTSKKVAAAIQHLQQANYRGKLEIISTITKPAVGGLDQMRHYVANLRVPLWRVAPVMPIGRAADAEHAHLIPTDEDVRSMLEYVRSSRQDKLLPSPEFSEEGFVGYRFEGCIRPYLCQCNAGVTVGGIRHNGIIGACPELSAAFDQGDIRRERFKDVWNNQYQVYRDRSWARKGPCAECSFFDICQGGALHLYQDTESSFLRCFYLMCKQTESRGSYKPLISASQWFDGHEKTR